MCGRCWNNPSSWMIELGVRSSYSSPTPPWNTPRRLLEALDTCQTARDPPPARLGDARDSGQEAVATCRLFWLSGATAPSPRRGDKSPRLQVEGRTSLLEGVAAAAILEQACKRTADTIVGACVCLAVPRRRTMQQPTCRLCNEIPAPRCNSWWRCRWEIGRVPRRHDGKRQ